MNYNLVAEQLDEAALKAVPLRQISHDQSFNLEEAYAIQSISLSHRYRRGDNWIGLKMGFTSRAKMEQMGVHDMIWGRLTRNMYYPDSGVMSLNKFIHPRAEPEIAFRIGRKIDRSLGLDEVKQYVTGLAVAIEIIDSRYENFKFSLEDVVADNCSSAAFTIGKWHSVDTQIENISMRFFMDDELVHEGRSSAILGNPWESLAAATRLASENGEEITEGAIILAGAATPAVYLESKKSIRVEAEGLGGVTLNILP